MSQSRSEKSFDRISLTIRHGLLRRRIGKTMETFQTLDRIDGTSAPA